MKKLGAKITKLPVFVWIGIGIIGLTAIGGSAYNLVKPQTLGEGINTINVLPEWKSILEGKAMNQRTITDVVLIGKTATASSTTILEVSGNSYFDGTASISGAIHFGNLISCDTIDSDATGLLSCGTDATGGGSGMLTHSLLGDWHSDSLEASVSEGSLLIGNATPKWSELTIGASNSFFMSNGTTAGWYDYVDQNTTYTGGDFLTLTGTDFDVDVAAVSNGDITHLSTADAIYDFVIGLNYLSTVDISANTNLGATNPLSLNGDTLTIDLASASGGGYLSGTDYADLAGHMASVNAHLDWTADQGATNIHAGNYTDTNTTYTSSAPIYLEGTNFRIELASTSGSGYLSNTDWDTFNAKESVITFQSPLVRVANTVSASYASAGDSGWLLAADWTTFNNKQGTITASDPLTLSAGTLSIDTASAGDNGVLSAANWTTFNGKQDALTFELPLINVGNVISASYASAGSDGWLSATDWSTFNGKQATITDGTNLTFAGATLNVDDPFTVTTFTATHASISDDLNVADGDIASLSANAFWGAGLADCDNATTSKLLWSDTGVFSCGTDQTGGGSMVTHSILSDWHSDSLEASVSAGSILYGNATPKWAELEIGASNSFLLSNGTTLAWNDIGNLTIGNTLTSLHASASDDLSVTNRVKGGSLSDGTLTITGGNITSGGNFAFTGASISDDLSLGAAGVYFSQDGDGELTIAGRGNGSDEGLTINFDDTANIIVFGTTTGVTGFDTGALGLEMGGTASVSGNWTLIDGTWDGGLLTSFELPNSIGITLSADGQAGIDTSEGQFLYRSNSSTEILMATMSFSFVMSSPSFEGTLPVAVKKFTEPITITAINCVAKSATSINFELEEGDANGANGATVDAAISCSTTNAADDGTLSNASFDAGDWALASADFSSISGEVDWLTITVDYKWTAQ